MSTHHADTPTRSAYFGEEHELLRAQLRRFVEEEIKPHALQWEQDGMVPRNMLRRMGELGFLGIRYPAEYGGSDMDTLATVVLAEELGDRRSREWLSPYLFIPTWRRCISTTRARRH